MRQVIKHRDIRLLNMIRRTDPVIPLFRSRYKCFRGKFSNFAAKQTLTMEQKFGKNSIDIEALPIHQYCNI